ncbi:MAG: alpha-2-macroglobulin family protein, partial [Chloroflexota bacterium]
ANGGALGQPIDWPFETIPAPQVLRTRPASGDTQSEYSSEFRIDFASPMRIASLKDRIQISPAPEKAVEWYYNEWDWSYTGWFLQPATRYTIRLLPGMQDIYGNTITRETVIRLTTADQASNANLLMPYDTPILRADGQEPAPDDAQQFYVGYTNVSQVQLQISELDLQQYVDLLTGVSYAYNYTPPQSARVWQTELPGNPARNRRTVTPVRPDTSGGQLPPGFYFLTASAPEIKSTNPYADSRMLIVANANLTLKLSPTDGLAWVTDLQTGKPLPGVPVRFYDNQLTVLGEGVTDADGMLYVELAQSKDPYAMRFALAEGDGVFAFASSGWGSGVNLYDYGVWADYYSAGRQPKAYVYTERPIYRPGQPVYFKGIVRIDNDLDYRLPGDTRVKVRITSYQETVYEETPSFSDLGTFNGRLDLDPAAALGYYTIDVFLGDDETSIGSVTFNVAEYRKPEFQAAVKAGPADLLPGESFSAQVQADYYSGGPVADAQVHWTLTSQPFYFSPPDEFSAYSFRDFEEDVYRYVEEYNGTRTIAEGEGRTNAAGSFSSSLPASLGEQGEGQTLTYEATLTDLAQTAVSGRAAVTVHPSRVYPGIRAAAYIGKEGEEAAFDLLALDWAGKPLAGQALAVEIVERRWYSVQEQDAGGQVTWKTTVEEIPVTVIDDLVSDAQGKATAAFTPAAGGVYRARVSARDDQGNLGKASAYLWVAGKEFIPWRQTNDRGFDLVTDKKNYQPGETAQVLIASPFQGEAYALVTVERGRIRHQEVLPLDTNSAVYKLRITPDMAPNAFVSVLIIKGVDEYNPRPNFKMGITKLAVDIRQKEVQVELQPDRAQAGPGEQVTYTVRTRDASGRPLSAEVSLSLSDLATLSLLPPNSPPALEYFYAQRNLAVSTSVGIMLDIEDYNQDIREEVAAGVGMGGGGGKGEGDLGVVEVRQDFPDTAFWDAQVLTGDSGEANVTVRLPDNLTTWRMEARALAEGTRVGQATVDLISSRPLLVRPQTPRFFIDGDQARLGSAVHNNTSAPLQVVVGLQAEGLQVSDPLSRTVTVPAKGQALVTWQAQVLPGAPRVDLVFSAEGGGYRDASRAPQGTLDNQGLPVYRYEAPETVGTSGMLTEPGNRIEGLRLPSTLTAGSGSLSIQLQPSLAAGVTDGLKYLDAYPFESIELTVSRFLPNVLSAQALLTAGLEDPELQAGLKEQVDKALQRLANWQNPDGGWGWWGGDDRSSPLVTAYAVIGLVEARQAGYGVDNGVTDRALNFLRTQIVPISGLSDPAQSNRQAFLLYALARAGAADISSTVQLYDQRQRMQYFAQAFLAQALYAIDPNDPRLLVIQSDLAGAAIVSATGTHWEEATTDRWNWNTDTRTTAIVLSFLSQADPKNPLNANAVRWLMSHRQEGHWYGSQETAWTLMALTRWMSASGELQANFPFAAGLNGLTIGSGVANRDTLRQTTHLTLDIRELLSGELNRLAFAHGEGPGTLYYTAHLNVNLPVEQVQPLERGLTVSRSYYRLDDLQTPVDQAALGDLLLARVTLVAPHDLHYAVVSDPLPAGLEGVDQSLRTSPQSVDVPQSYSWEDIYWRGFGWWNFDRIQYMDEKVVLSATYLPAGTYIYIYLVRAGTPGQFRVIPVTGQELYFPEVYGRGAGTLFTVTP